METVCLHFTLKLHCLFTTVTLRFKATNLGARKKIFGLIQVGKRIMCKKKKKIIFFQNITLKHNGCRDRAEFGVAQAVAEMTDHKNLSDINYFDVRAS